MGKKVTVLDMYYSFRTEFPELTEKADKAHIPVWGDMNPEFAYSWFESLANALNLEMAREVPVKKYKPVFEFLRKRYHQGNELEKDCIDVSFTENLFWQIKPEKSEPYWSALPQMLKDLYLAFHFKEPTKRNG